MSMQGFSTILKRKNEEVVVVFLASLGILYPVGAVGRCPRSREARKSDVGYQPEREQHSSATDSDDAAG